MKEIAIITPEEKIYICEMDFSIKFTFNVFVKHLRL